ncbi:predicted protein [Arabidopsis lyrata subsp. lyrata]|uniref:Predicted protein n=1 Tax=Arabidopsis lyrata subsp. lyrata TaxID=81972 RepID=D7LBC2_ARALL|nr:predicted protein [Arabidopsis lyrata subsp. lyrata]
MTKDAIRKPLAIQQNIFYTLISLQSNIHRSVCNRLASLYPESDAAPINSKNLASEEAAKDDPRLDQEQYSRLCNQNSRNEHKRISRYKERSVVNHGITDQIYETVENTVRFCRLGGSLRELEARRIRLVAIEARSKENVDERGRKKKTRFGEWTVEIKRLDKIINGSDSNAWDIACLSGHYSFKARRSAL